MNLFIYQLKQAYLSLKNKPGFVFSVVSTMGITLGALLCVLTLAYVMLLKPLPYPDQERLVNVEHQLISNENKVDGRAFTYPNLMYLYNNQTVFEQTALLYFDGAVLTSSLTEPMVDISFVTPQWFGLFAAKLALGRGFEQSERVNSHNPVAVISYQMWQDEYDGIASILDEKVAFGGRSYRVVGVLAKNNIELPLAGPGFKSQIYVPWDFNTVSEYDRKAWGNDDGGLMFVGKLKAEFSNDEKNVALNQQLKLLVNNNWQQQVADRKFFKGWSINLSTRSLKTFIVADGERSVYLLIIGALGLVLIACANIANIFISRTAERQHHLAISAAIGASRKQLFSQLVVEIGLLMFVAIIVAQIVSLVGFSMFHLYLSDFLPRINELELSSFSMAVSFFLLILLTLVFAYFCQKMINYRALNTSLQSSGKGNGVQVSKRIRSILISSQIAIATTLIFINVVLYQDASKLIDQPLGYQTDNIVAAVLALPNTERTLQAETLGELKQQLALHPKILSVSQAMRPTGFRTLALTTSDTEQRYTALGKDVDNHYFELIEQQVIEGDNFSETDIKDGNKLMIVNDVFARRLAPTGSAIGTAFGNGFRIVGVVKSINIPGQRTQQSRFYYPSRASRNMLLVKIKPNQNFSREEFISLLKEVDKKLSVFSFTSLAQYKSQRLFAPVTTAFTTIVLTLITCFLSGLGLYGILSYASQMRRFEIGTRMAIGAKGKDIIALVFKDNLRAIGMGVVISCLLLLAVYLGFSIKETISVSLTMLILFIITLVLISVLSSIACYLPLRQYINKPAIDCLKGSE